MSLTPGDSLLDGASGPFTALGKGSFGFRALELGL